MSIQSYTECTTHNIEIKLGTIEDRVILQMKHVIMDYVSDKMNAEDVKNKPKPYYRKGRWE